MAIPTSAVGPFRSIMTGYADNFGYLLNYYIYLYLELFGYIPREEYTCEGGIGDNGSSFWGSAGLLIVYETFNVVRENLNYKETCCRRREFKIIRIMLEWDGLELFRHIQTYARQFRKRWCHVQDVNWWTLRLDGQLDYGDRQLQIQLLGSTQLHWCLHIVVFEVYRA